MLSSKDPHWRHLTAGSLPSLAPDPQNGIVLGKCLVLPAATSTESLKLQPGHWGNGRFVTCILWYLMVSHDLMESRSLFGRIEHLGCPAPLRWDSGSPLGRLWDHSHAVLHKSWGAQWSQWRLLWSIGNSWQLMSITSESARAHFRRFPEGLEPWPVEMLKRLATFISWTLIMDKSVIKSDKRLHSKGRDMKIMKINTYSINMYKRQRPEASESSRDHWTTKYQTRTSFWFGSCKITIQKIGQVDEHNKIS